MNSRPSQARRFLERTSKLTYRPAAPLQVQVWVSIVHFHIELWVGWRFLSRGVTEM
jgi:hypothetical protein